MGQINWKIEKKKVKDLIPYAHNPRVIKDKQFNELKKSIEKFGYVDLIIVNKDMTIIGGHQRLKALMDQGKGEEEIDVRVPEKQLKEADLQELNIRLNLNKGEFDFSVLQSKAWNVNLLLNAGFEKFQIGAHNAKVEIPRTIAAMTNSNSENTATNEVESQNNVKSDEDYLQSIIPEEISKAESEETTKRNQIVFDILMFPEVRDALVAKLKEIKEQHGYEYLWQSFEHLIKTIV